MDFNAVIKKFETEQIDIETKLNHIHEIFDNEDKLWQAFAEVDKDLLLNDKAMSLLADRMQLVNNPVMLSQFELNTIEYIYELLVRFYPDNIQYRIDLILFVNNVLGEDQKAKKLTNETISFIEEKRKYLEHLCNS